MAPHSPYVLIVPSRFVDEMIAQARAELPNECCGLLAGTFTQDSSGKISTVVARYPLINEAASPTEYLSESRSMLAAHKDIDRRQLELLAIYHSHPTSAPNPSKKDREQSYSDQVVNFIISLASEPPQIKAWWITPDNSHPAEWQVVEARG